VILAVSGFLVLTIKAHISFTLRFSRFLVQVHERSQSSFVLRRSPSDKTTLLSFILFSIIASDKIPTKISILDQCRVRNCTENGYPAATASLLNRCRRHVILRLHSTNLTRWKSNIQSCAAGIETTRCLGKLLGFEAQDEEC
jgi:hypothetical protein